MSQFALNISYAQIAVFRSNLASPFNDWHKKHTDQGFSWRDESVSFRTLKANGLANVSVSRVQSRETRADTVRAIAVPFLVPRDGSLEIASIGDAQPIEMAPGDYRLVSEHGLSNKGDMWCDLVFVPVSAPVGPEIVRGDPELTPSAQLLMKAKPA